MNLQGTYIVAVQHILDISLKMPVNITVSIPSDSITHTILSYGLGAKDDQLIIWQVKVRITTGLEHQSLVPDRKEELLSNGNVRNTCYYSKVYLCELQTHL